MVDSTVEGLRALEKLTTQVNAAVDQINASFEDANGRDAFAQFVEAGLREVQKSCRAFDAKLKKLQKERDKA